MPVIWKNISASQPGEDMLTCENEDCCPIEQYFEPFRVTHIEALKICNGDVAYCEACDAIIAGEEWIEDDE